MKLKPRERVLLVVLAVLVVGLMYYQFFLSGYLRQLAQIKQQTMQVQQQLSQVQAKISQLPVLQQRAAQLKDDYSRATHNVPAALYEPELMAYTVDQIQDLGSDYTLGLHPANYFSQDMATKAIDIRLQTQGKNWLSILQRFQTSPYKNRILTVHAAVGSVEADPSQPELADVQVSLEFTIEYLAFNGTAQYQPAPGVTKTPYDAQLLAPAPGTNQTTAPHTQQVPPQ